MGLLKPTNGTILFNSLDINYPSYSMIDYQSHLSYVSSKPYIIDSTILDNILLNSSSSSTSYDQDYLSTILDIVSYLSFVILSRRLQYCVGQNGSNLSGYASANFNCPSSLSPSQGFNS